MKKTLSILLALINLFFSSPIIYAAQAPGNDAGGANSTETPTGDTSSTNSTTYGCLVTKVGNPQEPSPTLSPNCLLGNNGNDTGGDNNLENAAIDIVHSQQQCIKLKTPFDATCLTVHLTGHYSAAHVRAFADRTKSFGGSCIECVGFVGMALALTTGDSTAITTHTVNGVSTPVSEAKDLFYDPEIIVHGDQGDVKYKFVQDGKPQPGDIGVAGDFNTSAEFTGPAGHILIVHNVNGTHFTAIESNFYNKTIPCGEFTIDAPFNGGLNHFAIFYHFFRRTDLNNTSNGGSK